MDSERIDTSLSDNSITTYESKFNELFPTYLCMGMTEEQYWDKDCNLVKYYRKAKEMKQKQTIIFGYRVDIFMMLFVLFRHCFTLSQKKEQKHLLIYQNLILLQPLKLKEKKRKKKNRFITKVKCD